MFIRAWATNTLWALYPRGARGCWARGPPRLYDLAGVLVERYRDLAPNVRVTSYTAADHWSDPAAREKWGHVASAMREAENARELIDALGQTVAILSGDDEARLAYDGVTTNPRLAKRDLLVIDVGGGSTEFTRGSAGGVDRHMSIPLGSVRLLEGNPVGDTPAAGQPVSYTHLTLPTICSV